MKNVDALSLPENALSEPFMETVLGWFRIARFAAHIKKGERVLDVGCGETARVIRSLSPKVKTIVGVDRKSVKVPLPSNCEAHVLSYEEKWPFQEKFDVAIFSASFHVVPEADGEKLLRKVAALLSPKGRILMTLPTHRAKKVMEVMAFKLGVLNPELNKEQSLFYTRPQVLSLFERCQLKIEFYRYFQFGMNTFIVARPA